jgi:hypothetical protein
LIFWASSQITGYADSTKNLNSNLEFLKIVWFQP